MHVRKFIDSLEMQEENKEWEERAIVVDSLAYTIKDLEQGTYRFRVRAENIHGRSEPGQSSDGVVISNVDNDPPSSLSTVDEQPDGVQEIVIKPGDEFKAQFTIHEELGKGRFGVVHKVTENDTGRTLAAKIVKCIKAKDKVKVSWFNLR